MGPSLTTLVKPVFRERETGAGKTSYSDPVTCQPVRWLATPFRRRHFPQYFPSSCGMARFFKPESTQKPIISFFFRKYWCEREEINHDVPSLRAGAAGTGRRGKNKDRQAGRGKGAGEILSRFFPSPNEQTRGTPGWRLCGM